MLDKHTFFIDFYVLTLSVAKVVFKIQWLKTLGPIITDYATLSMEFQCNCIQVSLRGINEGNLGAITSSQLKRIQATNAIPKLYHLQMSTTTSSSLIEC